MKKLFLAIAVILMAASSARAIDVQNFQPAIGTQNLVTLYSSTTYAPGQFGFSLMANYAGNPVVMNFTDDKKLKIVETMGTAELSGAVGVFKFLELGVAGNYSMVSGKDLDAKINQDIAPPDGESASGLGDVRAMIKVRILENKPKSVGIAIVPVASFPTGDPDSYFGAGAVNAGGRLVIDKRFDRVNFVLNGGYIYMADKDGADKGFDPTGRAEFGAGATVMAHKYIELLAEIYGRTVDYKIDHLNSEIPTEAVGAVKLFAGPVHFIVGGGAGVNPGIGNPNWRGFAGVALTVPKQQRAPVAAAPKISYDSKTVDTDTDGLTNYDETNVYHTDPLNPDTDGDGLKDGEEVNTYHTDPLKADTDGDGLTDYEEVKVYGTDPLKQDTDGDTLSDGYEVKQLRTNPLDPDTDHDGIPDNLDGSPLEPETVNGIRDEDGIPEVILERKPSGVTLTDSFIWLPEKLVFMGPGGAMLDKGGKRLLKDVVAILKDYPAIKIEVQSHVAPGQDKNADLSMTNLRARTVMETLFALGAPRDRVSFKGYGSEFPYVSNSTEEGRQKNDRIDLVIIEK